MSRPMSVRRASLTLFALVLLGCGQDAGSAASAMAGDPVVKTAASSATLVASRAPKTKKQRPKDNSQTQAEAAQGDADAPKQGDAAKPKTKKFTQRKPATAAEIIKVLDVQTLPRLQVTQILNDTATYIYYSAKATVAAADAFYGAELKSRGWKQLESAYPATDQYSDNLYQKDGFNVRVSIGAGGDEGVVGVGISNLGNIEVRALPRLDDAEEMGEPTSTNITYRTRSGIGPAAKFCREQLAARGWRTYTDFHPGLDSVPHYHGFQVFRSGLRLHVSISRDPKNTAEKTSVSYLASEAMPYDVPVDKDGSNVRIDLYSNKAAYESSAPVADLAEFYQSAAKEYGWRVRPDESNVSDDGAALYLEDPSKLGWGIEISRVEGKSKVELTRLSFEEAPAAASATDVAASDAPSVDTSATDTEPADETPSEPTDVTADDDPADDAVDEAQAEIQREVRKALKGLDGKGIPPGVLDQFQDQFKELMEDEDDDSDDSDSEDSDSEDGDSEDGDSDDDSDDGDDETDAAVAEGEADEPAPEVVTSAGEVDLKAIADKGTSCTIRLGDEKYELKHAIAIQQKWSDKLTPVVMFSIKPFNKAKLARALASGEDISAHDITEILAESIEITLSDSYSAINCSCGGASINRTSSDIKAGFEIDGNRLRGQASLTGQEVFDEPFSFEATFDLELQSRAAGANADVEAAELTRNAQFELPAPDGAQDTSEQGSAYRKVLTARIDAPLDKVAEFYRREMAADQWEADSLTAKTVKDKPDLVTLAYRKPEGRMTVTLRMNDGATSIEVVSFNDQLASEQGMKPAAGKARIVLGNASETEIVITVAGRDYKLASGIGADDPSQAVKVDVKPGKYTLTIKPKGGKKFTEAVDVPSGASWGVIVIPGGQVFAERMY